MGVMRFFVHPPEVLQGTSILTQAYLSGLDGRIYPTKVEMDGNLLTFRRSISDSCKLNISWPVETVGVPMLTTTSLREREAPYHLPLELARGKLSEIRENAANWEQGGMMIPEMFRNTQREAFELLARSSTQVDRLEESARLAAVSIEKSCEASAILMDAYTIQRLTNLRRIRHHSSGLLGCAIDNSVLTSAAGASFEQAFNSASIAIDWNDIESVEGEYHWDKIDQLVDYAVEKRAVVRGGPLVDLSLNGLPRWLAPWVKDFQNLPSFVCDYIDTVIRRYQGRIRQWEVVAYGNTGGALGLGEDHCLALVARVLEAASRTDNDSRFFIRIDCPWGEYQRLGMHRLSPFQFVDALVRSNLGLAGVSLDITAGYGPDSCFTRDMQSISKLIDFWSLLQVQIHVNIACPSSTVPDPQADPRYEIVDRVWKRSWDQELQAEWVDHVVPVLLAKPAVTGVFLSSFHDGEKHRYPHSGLLTANGEPKLMLETLRQQLHQEL